MKIFGPGIKSLSEWISNPLQRFFAGQGNWSEYPIAGNADELHHVKTHDETIIGLWRFKRTGANSSHNQPVLLVHGLGANHRNLTLDENYGLAQYLNRKGFDCWAIDLRGRGASEDPGFPWTFDDYAKLDLPAAIDYVIGCSQYDKLHWVGHSMGGMLYYALAGSLNYDQHIASGITMASPVDFPDPGLLDRLGGFLHNISFDFKLPSPRKLAEFIHLGKNYFPPSILKYLYNPGNMDTEILLKAARQIPAGTSSKVLTQFPEWFIRDQWIDQNDRIDYRQGLANIDVPSLVIAGAVDKLTPPELIKSGFDQLNSPNKRFVLAGKLSGYQNNYSHIDLVFGRDAPREIFPLIGDWLKSNSIKKPLHENENDEATA